MELLFASHNQGKTKEIQALLGEDWEVKNLHDLGISTQIEETGKTLEENALIKAKFLADNYGKACFADDSGLEVEALDGQPGVYSARFAGPQKSDQDNMDLLLAKLADQSNRAAQFKTVITFIDQDGDVKNFEGSVAGEITSSKRGSEGFGYDPIFIPNGKTLTFAEMSVEDKNKISHRAKAVEALVSYLKNKTA